jgi:protein AroM
MFSGVNDEECVMAGKLGLLTIGQSPRPDYESIFHTYAGDAEIIWAGALDGLSREEALALNRPDGPYPLHSGLNDGTQVDIDMSDLLPLVTVGAATLVEQGADLVVLVCAGGFPEFDCDVPLILPGKLLPAVLGSFSKTRRIGVVTPIPGQIEPARKKWTEDGFHVDVAAASPYHDEETEAAARALSNPDLEMILLDCMGHNSRHQREFAELTGRPVLVAQNIVARVAGEYVAGCAGTVPVDKASV